MTIKSAGNDESHIRSGEVQVPLPTEPDASLYFIGRRLPALHLADNSLSTVRR